MKEYRKFILFIILLAVIAFAIEISIPKKFIWVPTYSHTDKQPFGSYVFDDVVGSSLKNGYAVSQKSFYQLDKDSFSTSPRSLLITAESIYLQENDIQSIFSLLGKGNKIMLVNSYFPYYLCDTLEIHDNSSYFPIKQLKESILQKSVGRDTLFLADSTDSWTAYQFYPQLCKGYFYRERNNFRDPLPTWSSYIRDSIEYVQKGISDTIPRWIDSLDIQVLAEDTSYYPVAIKIPIHKGELYLVANPLIFTNYGMLDENNAGYIFGILSHISDYPIIRSEAYNSPAYRMQGESPFRYFIGQRPLRWCLYLTVLCILLFMCFTAKRRQRVIPVIEPPVNRTLEFVELIGTLYSQRKDYTDLTLKKYIYFAEQLKRLTHIDIEAEELSAELCNRVSNKTGIEANTIHRLLSELTQLKQGKTVDEEQMKDYINRMNEILNHSR